MSPVHFAFASLFSIWTAMVIIRQVLLKKPPKILRYLTVNGFSFLCPVYSLFAPNPVFYDIHVLYRILKPGVEGLPDFKELSFSKERTVMGTFWNPSLRVQKLIVSAIRDISKMHVDMKREGREEELQKLIKIYPSWNIVRTYVLNTVKTNEPLSTEGHIQIAFVRSQYHEKKLAVKPYMVHTFKMSS